MITKATPPQRLPCVEQAQPLQLFGHEIRKHAHRNASSAQHALSHQLHLRRVSLLVPHLRSRFEMLLTAVLAASTTFFHQSYKTLQRWREPLLITAAYFHNRQYVFLHLPQPFFLPDAYVL
ncbi:hypothetical protein NDU88_002159 [Pleurodeles waltl]|uniref:Uncharacterized protein n=1 Tax=Pleurodeles waltl TaxID=8319 RepID=A0AAV7MWK9_PLEWA|nr:hypothetical protein NDU88_002159 [Pleurodeles waltl]